jgi:hypothetical protein
LGDNGGMNAKEIAKSLRVIADKLENESNKPQDPSAIFQDWFSKTTPKQREKTFKKVQSIFKKQKTPHP